MAAQVTLEIVEPGADEERLDERARSLRRELEELDVERVERASGGPAPAGTRSIEFAAVATLIVTLKESSALAGGLVRAMRSWLNRGEPGTKSIRVKIGDKELELSGASDEVTAQLLQEFTAALRRQ
jgi:hypothetical protein